MSILTKSLAAISLCRPKQWLKNIFIIAPIFFDRKLFETSSLLPVILVLMAFCFIASSIYCLNDIIDCDIDRKHPVKKLRPIASGEISKLSGGGVILILITLFSLMMLYVNNEKLINRNDFTCVLQLIIVYLITNISYSLYLKKIIILDVFVIAFGFVIRLFLGAIAGDVLLSHWIVLMTFLLALFLAFAKRRDDVVQYECFGEKLRKNIDRYNLPFMNQVITIIGTITIVCYILYTVSPEALGRFQSRYLYLTSIFVLLGIIRYLQLTIVDVKSGSPTKVLLTDRFLQITIILWLASFFFIIYA